MEYVISERGKKNSKTCDSERYQFNQLNFFKMLQNNLNLEYVENNIIQSSRVITIIFTTKTSTSDDGISLGMDLFL